MQIPVQSFTTMVEQMAAAVQGSAPQLVDFSVGSTLRALMEACAGVALWLQWFILQVLSTTRAATSQGSSLDSWVADFGLTRLPASAANVDLVFSRFTPGTGTTIPVGATVMTGDGTVTFQVVGDAGNTAWNGSTGYTLAASLASVTVPATAMAPGSAGNVLPATISVITSPILGVDSVTNPQAAAGGVDAESDTSLRVRFVVYINSRSLATTTAIDFALGSLQPGLRWSIVENQDTQGDSLPGSFCVTIDDGSGHPPSALVAAAQLAIEAVRPIGSSFAVEMPTIIPVSVQANITTNNPATLMSVISAAQSAITAWIEGLSFGATLSISKIEAIIHGVDPSVISVSGTSINSASVDLVAGPQAIFIVQSVVIE